MTCDMCGKEIKDAPVVVPSTRGGNSHYHARRYCRTVAEEQARTAWPARNRARKIREAEQSHGA